MRDDGILSRTYAARIDIVEALLAAADRRSANHARLRTLATALDAETLEYGEARVAFCYSALASLTRIVAMLVEWRAAVLEAGVDADRFLRSAHELYRGWLEEYEQREEVVELATTAEPITAVSSIDHVGAICRSVAMVPLPIGIYAIEYHHRTRDGAREDKGDDARPPELTVAFVRFSVDGRPAGELDLLTPRQVHDLEIEVRISRWPDNALALCLSPVTIEPRSVFEFPTFRFARPLGNPPYRLKDRQRAILHVSQGLDAQPFEFRYAADFEPAGVEQPLAVVGHRNLRIDAFDRPITGYQGVDQRLLEMRALLRQRPLVTPDDVTHTLTLVSALGSLCGQAMQDNLFPDPVDEAEFQKYVRRFLRERPQIGSKLEEHPRAGAGITDLSFEGIRLELKSDDEDLLHLADCQRYVGQTTSYAAGSDKRVSVLCVLDGSLKTTAPFPAEDGIGILTTEDDAIAVVTVLIQGNLARPSDLSRRASRKSHG